MDWVQCFPPHPLKGYTLDLLFASPGLCKHIDLEEELVRGDPLHHESAFFVLNGEVSTVAYNDSENAPLKNFYKANYDTINSCLDIDWNSILEPGDIDFSMDKFYNVLNNVIDLNVPSLTTAHSHFPPWYSQELIGLVIEKRNYMPFQKSPKDLT